jgi:ABC-type Mn2+/Zn2+ transport system permease subunit
MALLATAIGGRHQRLAALAIVVGAVCFVVGMALAVLTDNPLY